MQKRIGKLQRQCRRAFWAANVSELPHSGEHLRRFALILFCYSTQRHSRYNDAAVTLGLKWWRRRCQSRAARIFT